MALTDGGQISISDIATEKGLVALNASLSTLSTTDINSNSAAKPNGAQPHSISEFYGYDHNAVGAVVVYPFNITEFAGSSGEACFFGPIPTVYKTGNPEVISNGDVFYNDENGLSPLLLEDGQQFSTYFNNDFGKIVFEYLGGQVTNSFVQGCGRSERRLKYNIEFIGESPMGIPMYYFNYINEAHGKGRYVGTMVDDLQRLGYSDVLSTVNGDVYVNYTKIDVPFMKLED